MRIGIVASRFNEEISGQLLERARVEARKLGVEAQVVQVPGALEIPVALQWLAQNGKCDALVAIGAVIRGDTYHFEVVANESARGVSEVSLESGLPVANAILTLRRGRSRSSASTRAPKACASPSRWRN
jgi:6,7-dimethyl-8-ribityllumazine synthase